MRHLRFLALSISLTLTSTSTACMVELEDPESLDAIELADELDALDDERMAELEPGELPEPGGVMPVEPAGPLEPPVEPEEPTTCIDLCIQTGTGGAQYCENLCLGADDACVVSCHRRHQQGVQWCVNYCAP